MGEVYVWSEMDAKNWVAPRENSILKRDERNKLLRGIVSTYFSSPTLKLLEKRNRTNSKSSEVHGVFIKTIVFSMVISVVFCCRNVPAENHERLNDLIILIIDHWLVGLRLS